MAKMPMEFTSSQYQSGVKNTDSNGEVSITFDKAFATIPMVTCTTIASSGNPYICIVKSVTTTGFTAVSKRADTGTLSGAGNPIYWFAVTGDNN